MPVLKIESSFVHNELHCPSGKSRIEYCDSDVPGLYILVFAQSQGQGTFYLRYKNTAGKTAHEKIGRTTVISLSDARKQAKKLKAEIALGASPQS